MSEKSIYEKMSKSKGNVVLPEEIVFGVATLKKGYVFRNSFGELVDYKKINIWQDNFNTGFFHGNTS